jgi:hypothetical protein
MKTLFAIILVILCLFSTGCQHFSAWDWGWITKNRKYKTGFIESDLMRDNALLDEEDKQLQEEFIKKDGFIFGIRIEQKF